jgi:hypothetical protein
VTGVRRRVFADGRHVVLHRYRNGLADEAGGAAREPMEVVEDQGDLTLVVKLIDQTRQHHLDNGSRADHLG